MKIKVYVTYAAEYEVNDPIFEKLRNIHSSSEDGVGAPEDYDKAIRIVEDVTGLPFYNFEKRTENSSKGAIIGVYDAEDECVILES